MTQAPQKAANTYDAFTDFVFTGAIVTKPNLGQCALYYRLVYVHLSRAYHRLLRVHEAVERISTIGVATMLPVRRIVTLLMATQWKSYEEPDVLPTTSKVEDR
jgi:hypothetical protein